MTTDHPPHPHTPGVNTDPTASATTTKTTQAATPFTGESATASQGEDPPAPDIDPHPQRQEETELLGSVPRAGGRINVLSLFTGIGGLDLGLGRAGMAIVGQVEINRFCQRVLAKHWPEVPRYDDIRTCVDWWRSEQRPRVDLVCGGFPCQPVSEAGRKLGAADERWLWPQMACVIESFEPTWVLWENVPGLLTKGLDIVHADLIRLGYRHRVGWASACSVGAPHARRRLFGVAHTTSVGRSPRGPEPRDPDETNGEEPGYAPVRIPQWPDEPDVGRVAYGVPGGVDRRQALGNAVVPQVAEYLGRLIMAAITKSVAMEAAGSSSAATTGSAVHSLTEQIDRGLNSVIPPVTAQGRAS